jgi:hypothetical protein
MYMSNIYYILYTCSTAPNEAAFHNAGKLEEQGRVLRFIITLPRDSLLVFGRITVCRSYNFPEKCPPGLPVMAGPTFSTLPKSICTLALQIRLAT